MSGSQVPDATVRRGSATAGPDEGTALWAVTGGAEAETTRATDASSGGGDRRPSTATRIRPSRDSVTIGRRVVMAWLIIWRAAWTSATDGVGRVFDEPPWPLDAVAGPSPDEVLLLLRLDRPVTDVPRHLDGRGGFQPAVPKQTRDNGASAPEAR